MLVTYISEPFPHIIVDDMYEDEELKLIHQELDMFHSVDKFVQPEESLSARSKDGEILKNNLGIHLDFYYSDRNSSHILRLNRKLWCDEIVENSKKHWGLVALDVVNSDMTLMSYYEKSHYYKPHFDAFNITAITQFYKKPKSFTGGVLQFPDYNYELTSENNRCIMFPSTIQHGVTEVTVDDDKLGKNYGRWSMSQFLKFVGEQRK